MTAANDRYVAVLNGLIETMLDSAYGYREAAGDAMNPAFKMLFEDRWLQRKQLTADLQAEVRSLGGTPDKDGTMLAAAQRIFFDLRDAMAGSDQSILDEVETGEDHVKAKFEAALASGGLPPSVREVVSRIHATIRADQGQTRQLKPLLSPTPVEPALLQYPVPSLGGA